MLIKFIETKEYSMGWLTKLFESKIDPEIEEMLVSGAKVIDVRTPQEFQGGNARNSINIPLDEVSMKILQIKKMNSPIVLVCHSGARANAAMSILKKEGVKVVNARSWKNLESTNS